jgi:hypothetical protein
MAQVNNQAVEFQHAVTGMQADASQSVTQVQFVDDNGQPTDIGGGNAYTLPDASATVKGGINQAVAVADVASADAAAAAGDAPTKAEFDALVTLANELKKQFNAKMAADRTAGEQAA